MSDRPISGTQVGEAVHDICLSSAGLRESDNAKRDTLTASIGHPSLEVWNTSPTAREETLVSYD